VPVPRRHHGHRGAGRLDDVDELLQLPGRAVQAVRMPGNHGVERAGLQVLQESPVRGPLLTRVGRDVVVFVDVDDVPGSGFAVGYTVLALAFHPGPRLVRVTGDADIHAGSHAGPPDRLLTSREVLDTVSHGSFTGSRKAALGSRVDLDVTLVLRG